MAYAPKMSLKKAAAQGAMSIENIFAHEVGSGHRDVEMPSELFSRPATSSGTAHRHEQQEAAIAHQRLRSEYDGSVRDERHALTPNEVHSRIKTFLIDNFEFRSAAQAQAFVRIISSIDDENKAWSADKAQAFLDMIVKSDGILRIGDVFRFDRVDTAVGTTRTILSFQNGYFPILKYFASNLVLRNTLHRNTNRLYAVLDTNYDSVHSVNENSISKLIEAKSWKDQTSGHVQPMQIVLDGVVVFKTLSTVLHQFLNRFKNAVRSHPGVAKLVIKLVAWFDIWTSDVSATPSRFMDPICAFPQSSRDVTIRNLQEDIRRLHAIVQRKSEAAGVLRRPAVMGTLTLRERRQAISLQLAQTHDLPGDLHDEGPRHANDHVNIGDIRIVPTHEELLCCTAPYLPVFHQDAPHHLPSNSMDKHIDILFRLSREELTALIRSSLLAIHRDLTEIWKRSSSQKGGTQLEELLSSGGGAYRTPAPDSIYFQVYTGVRFSPVRAERHGVTVGLTIDTPARCGARDPDATRRYEFWESSKRLQTGCLVTLVVVSNGTLKVYLGVVASYSEEIAESSSENPNEVHVGVSFFDSEVELMALRRESLSTNRSTFAILIDSNVMYEATRHVLEKLQTTEPLDIPFSQYIANNGSLRGVDLRPPRYATAPGFKFDLDCLNYDSELRHEESIESLDITQAGAIELARQQLSRLSKLDPSQIDALLNTLTREVSLIQGPPGTGKSFTAKEILRVLFASGIKPIVLISFTNHALDHLLASVLDAEITRKIVRLGSRSSDPRVMGFTLNNLENVDDDILIFDNSINRQYAIMKTLEAELNAMIPETAQPQGLSWQEIADFLDCHYPEHHESILYPPFWISGLFNRALEDEKTNGKWITVGQEKSGTSLSHTLYGFWRDGGDIQFLKSADLQLPDIWKLFTSFGNGESLPTLPTLSRPTEDLLQMNSVWSMSVDERGRLSREWEQRIQTMAHASFIERYEQLREDYREACESYRDIVDETRRRRLCQADLIGCTTSGAAKLTSLLSSIAPRVLMVEEAGQVLEAHVLASLVPSVEHLICIGDPKQLRPTLTNFALSMDSESGKQLYKFDRSMMERLADNELPMSQINVQRRMRPSISHIIRHILYPKLEDNELVFTYPPVVGMQKDVFFFDHTHKENDSNDSVSKSNDFEVKVVVDLVLYLLQQGA
ncbi:uncharacterized protein FIBRA_00535 [Fibroporia radiculosa]|uniref:AAA+ ATPase domain-containing protein n=1 Tax=Fibroporia radiculosa TaxID=599839 RepID=J4I7Z8_9APHY|nr:uncharacterized protein FIBRA_00535 [Fibroporia radiculosa]CCL98536.1 predicted protein [Fibroporia radiculosa]